METIVHRGREVLIVNTWKGFVFSHDGDLNNLLERSSAHYLQHSATVAVKSGVLCHTG